MVSADKMPPAEAIKEGHAKKDGQSDVAPTSRDNTIVAQGKSILVALLGMGNVIQHVLSVLGHKQGKYLLLLALFFFL